MKKLLISIIVLSLVSIAFAEPFIVCDPAQNVSKYQLRLSADNGTTWSPWTEGPAQSDGSMKFDLVSTPPGNYKGEAQAFGTYQVTDSTTGQVSTASGWSSSAPFLLGTPNSTRNIKIIK